jgi:hypothetical protein
MSMLGGCVYVPVLSPARQSAMFGSGPEAPFRVGRTTRSDVLATFGEPRHTYTTRGPWACGYVFGTTTGKLFGVLLTGPCSTLRVGEADVEDVEDVCLVFDARGVLQRVDKRRQSPWSSSEDQSLDNWHRFIDTVGNPAPPASESGGPR